MKHLLTFASRAVLAIALIGSCGFGSVFAQVGEKESFPAWNFGYMRITALQDAAGEFPAALFPEASKEQLEKYMPEGKAPNTVSTFLLQVPGAKPDGKNILFDTGNGNDRSELFTRLEKLNIPLESIDEIYLTHMHGDHIGGLLKDGKRTFPKAKVYSVDAEYDYWCPEGGEAKNKKLDAIKKAYGNDFTGKLKFGQSLDVILGETPESRRTFGTITLVEAVGHTPGHVCFLIESREQKFMIIGDLLHAAAIQLPVPELCPRYDMNPKEAVASRKRILDLVAKEQIPIGAMHLPAPSLGYIKVDGEGGYVFLPLKDNQVRDQPVKQKWICGTPGMMSKLKATTTK